MDNDIYMDYLNNNAPEKINQFGGDCRKISVDLMFDDKSLFPGWLIVPVIVLWAEWKERRQKMRRNLVKEVSRQ
jgi:hypothetical protein